MKKLSIAIALGLFMAPSGALAEEKNRYQYRSFRRFNQNYPHRRGDKRALELISLRPFSSLDDLARIKGIGPARIEDIKKQGLAYVGTSSQLATELSEITNPTTKAETEKRVTSLETELKPSLEDEANNVLRGDINTASIEDLQVLRGIGPILAQRITDLRTFHSVDDLIKVNGISPETLEDIKKQGLA
jgi:DNA uptake protein ComE-like DNA-binding protein